VAKVQKLPAKTTLNTDTLTGERLSYRPGTVRLPTPDDDRICYPHGDPQWLNGYRVALPLRLHTRTPEGRLGAPTFGRRTMQYLASQDPRKVYQEHTEYELRNWWTPPWAERELYAFYDAEAVDIVLSVVRDAQTWEEATRGVQRPIAECKAIMRNMRRHCQRLITAGQRAA
jgi:hypothetical protein